MGPVDDLMIDYPVAVDSWKLRKACGFYIEWLINPNLNEIDWGL